MIIHEVVISPAAGHSVAGSYSRGHELENVCELDIVDRYVRSMCDELDHAAIRHRILPVRTPPGISEGTRHEAVLPNCLLLDCRLGWCDKPPSKRGANKSRIFMGQGAVSEMACLIGEAMAHWGHIYISHDHRGANPIVDQDSPMLTTKGVLGLRLEPFVLNGPDAKTYCTKLEELGRDIGRTIADYMIARNASSRSKPSSLNTSLLR